MNLKEESSDDTKFEFNFFQSTEEAREFQSNDKDKENFKYCANLFYSEREHRRITSQVISFWAWKADTKLGTEYGSLSLLLRYEPLLSKGYKMWRERKVDDLVSHDGMDELSARL